MAARRPKEAVRARGLLVRSSTGAGAVFERQRRRRRSRKSPPCRRTRMPRPPPPRRRHIRRRSAAVADQVGGAAAVRRRGGGGAAAAAGWWRQGSGGVAAPQRRRGAVGALGLLLRLSAGNVGVMGGVGDEAGAEKVRVVAAPEMRRLSPEWRRQDRCHAAVLAYMVGDAAAVQQRGGCSAARGCIWCGGALGAVVAEGVGGSARRRRRS